MAAKVRTLRGDESNQTPSARVETSSASGVAETPQIVAYKWLRSNRYFPNDGKQLRIRSSQEIAIEQCIDVPKKNQDLICPIPVAVQADLHNISQLGLKEKWLREKKEHTRWRHSVGAMNAAYIWLGFLQKSGRVPDHCFPEWCAGNDRWKILKSLVCVALLLHDYGHLPFSHLLNEALGSINWLPPDAIAGGLELAILHRRFRDKTLQHCWETLSKALPSLSQQVRSSKFKSADKVRSIIEALIAGRFASAWIQAICNSPIDADKLDYVRFDGAFLRNVGYPIQTRINDEEDSGDGRRHQWLGDFLSDQEVNGAGLICLNGASARAAADMWRERMFLHDRFYVSPELRCPERITLEILQQFLIRSVVDSNFTEVAKEVFGLEEPPKVFSHAFDEASQRDEPLEPIEAKFESVRKLMLDILPRLQLTGRELEALDCMITALRKAKGVDPGSQEFLRTCFQHLEEMSAGKKTLSAMVAQSLVREPITIARSGYRKARELLRPLQHAYSREVLIDLISLPRVLSAPKRWRYSTDPSADTELDYTILVPQGPVSTWGPGSKATVPLTDACVAELERPYCRICVIAPGEARSARTEYIWDRVRTVLARAGLKLFEQPTRCE